MFSGYEAILTFAGRTIIHATITYIRWHGSHSHFRRSARAIWVGLIKYSAIEAAC